MRIFYRSEMVAPRQGFSPSPAKPKLVVAKWIAEFEHRITLGSFEPVTRGDLQLVHAKEYVDGVLQNREMNGFGTIDPVVTATLPYTVGSMVAAARHALFTGECSASPTSGFHHAGYKSGGGYCTFNGLMMAATSAHLSIMEPVVGILDADMHYGDGTDDIIKHLGYPHWCRHWSVGRHWGKPEDAIPFIEELPGMVEVLLTLPDKLDLLLYQAGADPHINDPLGGWLTTEQLQQRDRIVFEQCRKHGVPIAWNLAGGYQDRIENVLTIHTNTMRAGLDVE